MPRTGGVALLVMGAIAILNKIERHARHLNHTIYLIDLNNVIITVLASTIQPLLLPPTYGEIASRLIHP